MPYQDEEYPDQPVWQSVLLFCCKGMIEGIMFILFFWLLVQVLFTKQLEVHLQILLLVGLIVFCLSLVLGCVVCWRTSQFFSGKKKTPATSSTPADLPESSHPSVPASQPLCQELRRDTLDYPSTFSSPARSQGEISSLPFGNQDKAASEEHEQAASYFSLRRLSSPLLPGPAYKPMHPGRASLPSLPSLPKLGLLTKNVPQRRCTVSGDCRSHTERSRLTNPTAISSSIAEKPLALTPLSYGSHANPPSANPHLHFTLAFSPLRQILTVTVLKLTKTSQRLENVSILGSLHPSPTQMSGHSSLSLDDSSLEILLKVKSVKELQRYTLRLSLHMRGAQNLRDTPLGEVELECGDINWISEHPLHFRKELKTKPEEF